ncbi:unnamed protein product [Fraxinus pennsylvanica]|uniref:Uncharacterized protein n=1 Tax=Fraxinus pennsylvanica TaxID=56036 RepID=A0AAD2EE46_9LAMI|nr:unnamed protein product [Fraxinus pennsylvanica]
MSLNRLQINSNLMVAAAHAIGAIAENVKHTSLTELSNSFEMKISEAGISSTFTDILTWPNRNPENSAGTSFRSNQNQTENLNREPLFFSSANEIQDNSRTSKFITTLPLAGKGEDFYVHMFVGVHSLLILDGTSAVKTARILWKDWLDKSRIFCVDWQLGDGVSDEEGFENDGDGGWPFQSFVEQLLVDMFDLVWEVRHGSIMAPREILTYQGASAGILSQMSCKAASVSYLKAKDDENTVKRERELDLNLLALLEALEPVLM